MSNPVAKCTCEIGGPPYGGMLVHRGCPIHGNVNDDETDGLAPTAWAYNQACKALDRKTDMLRRIRALNVPETRYWIRADGLPKDGAWVIPWDDIERILDGG
jgi:hypothetical protein